MGFPRVPQPTRYAFRAMPPTPPPSPPRTFLQQADARAARQWWVPRLAPLLVWLLFLAMAHAAAEWAPVLLPLIHAAQITATAGLLWRWRGLLPELSAKFHWAALPAALIVLVSWLLLGWWCRGNWDHAMHSIRTGSPMAGSGTSALAGLLAEHPALGRTVLGLRLLGMVFVVPCIEELLFRCAIARAFPTWRSAARPFLQVISDWPWIGGWADRVLRAATWHHQQSTPAVGRVTWVGIAISTLFFALNHQRVDWAGAAVAGLVWHALLALSNRPKPAGLGPAIWSHALVNLWLWIWCVWRGDWAFL